MTLDDHIEATARALMEAALAAGMTISGDGRVCERDAEALLGYSRRYLRQLRDEGRGPSAYPIGVGGGRVSYRLVDLAEWIESTRNNFSEPMADNGG